MKFHFTTAYVLLFLISSCASLSGATPAADSLSALQKQGALSKNAGALARRLALEVGSRLTGSAGEIQARAWALKEMAAVGLVNVHTEPVTALRWERGQEAVLLNGTVSLRGTALATRVATSPEGVEGDVVEITSVADAEKQAAKSALGKILFLNIPMKRTRNFEGYADGVKPRWIASEVGEKIGAIGVVIRSVTTESDNQPHTGATKLGKLAVIALSPLASDTLHAAIQQGRARLKMISLPKSDQQVEVANVIGELPGTTHPEQVVLLSAHLDSWDLAQGALDDAAGIGAVLEVARLIKNSGRGHERTLRIVLFANEENGLAGAQAYAAAHAAEIKDHIAALEADSGTDKAFEVLVNGGPEATVFLSSLTEPLSTLGVSLGKDLAHGGADLGPLLKQGVPVMDVAQDVSHYFDVHHSPKDRADQIHDEALAQVATTYAVITQGLLNSATGLGIPSQTHH